MESNDPLCQKVSSELSKVTASEQEISTDGDLNDLYLEAIAGGCSDGADQARAAGMRVATTRDRPNDIITKSQAYYEDLARILSNSK